MPIYEYKCSACGNEQENLVRTDSDIPVCEKCGGEQLNKKLSVFAVAGSSPSAASNGDCACASGGGGGCHGEGHSSGGGCGCAGH